MQWGKLSQNWLPKCTGSTSGLHCADCSAKERCCLCDARPEVQPDGCVHGSPACEECIQHDTMLAMSS